MNTLMYEEISNKVVKISFNRPQALNALNQEMLKELDGIIDKVKKNTDIKYLLFTGCGKAFIAGADITEMKDMNNNEALEYGRLGSRLFRKIETLDKITIALVNGYCLGGGNELALACDFRFASTNAKFGQPEVTLGITPGFSGSCRLPRLVGLAKAKELLYTGKIIDAQEALAIGLVNRIEESDKLYEAGINFVETLEKNSFNALMNIKHMMLEGLDAPLEDAIELENIYFSRCFDHFDQKEGMTAFIEKRKPIYK